MDDSDLATRLDRSIGPAPDGATAVPTLLAEGRRTVRRRRRRAGATSLAAVVALGLGATALVDRGSSDPSDPPPASSQRSDDALPGRDDFPLRYTRAGELRLAPDYDVVMRVDDPLVSRAGGASVAMVLEDPDGERVWALAVDGGLMAFTPADAAGTSFRSWVDSERTAGLQLSPAGGPLVRFEGGRLTPLLGVTVLAERRAVDLGPSFATADDDVAAAEVRSPGGETFYVLGRQGPDIEPWIWVVTRTEGGADLDAFLDRARDRWGGAGAQ